MADNFPNDYVSFPQFERLHPNVASRWEMRFRHENGLMADGVVIERRADPKASRPSILISPSRYFDRLKRLSRGAAA